MRIAFLQFHMHGGGAERMVGRLANAFIERGLAVDIVFLEDMEHIAYPLDLSVSLRDCLFSDVKGKRYRQLKQVLGIRRYIKKYRPDVMLCFGITVIPFATLAKIGCCHFCKLIGSQRTNPQQVKLRYRLMVAPFLRFCDGFIFQTAKAKKCYPVWLQERSAVIGNVAPTIPQRIDAEKQKVMRDAICSVGRLHSDKDWVTLFRAFAEVLQTVSTASLHIYGEGPMEQELRQLAKQLDISENIVFEGFFQDIIAEIKRYDIFAFSSKAEGMPNALMEAMAVGLACVATDCDYGPAELIEDGVNGYLVPVGDAEWMATRLVELLHDEKKRQAMQREARKISDRFSEEKIVNAYLDYIREICVE